MRWTFHRKISLHLSCSRASFSVSTQMPNAKVKAEDSTPLFRYFASHPLRWVTNVRIPFSLWFYPPNLLVMDPGICINLLNRLLYIFVIFDTSPKGQSESKSIHIHSHIYICIDWIGFALLKVREHFLCLAKDSQNNPAVSRAYGQFQRRQKNCSLCCDGNVPMCQWSCWT